MSEKKYRVSDYMQKEVVTLLANNTLREAIETMLAKHTNGVVIIDTENKVTGILSVWDIIQYIVPDYLEEDRHLAAFESEDLFASRILELQNEPVEKFMTKDVTTCKADHSLMEAATLLSEFRVRQLPIVNEEHKLVGYVSRTNVKKAIGDILGF